MIFPQIDLLRGFAALSVVIFHVIAHFNWVSFPTSGPLVWFRIGGFSVDLFFVISGFVISLSALRMLERSENRRSFYKSFVCHRLARIVPLYYLTCLLFVIYLQPFVLFDHRGWWQVLTHSLFIHNLILMHQGGINGVNWSVGTEMQFYALMLVIAPWLARCSPWQMLVGSLIIAWSWRGAAFYLTSIHGPLGAFPRFVYETQLPGMLDEFAFGAFLARWLDSPAGQHFIMRNPHRLWLCPGIAAGFVALTLHVYWAHATFWDSVTTVVFLRSMIAVSCAAVVLTACAYSFPAAVLATAPLRYLGVISYGIYLWHLGVIVSFEHLTWLHAGRALPMILVVTILLAMLSWHFMEKPLLRRFSGRMPSRIARGDLPHHHH